jgi:hypothetical protein
VTHNERPIHALLRELIDYAGLFPPAGLDMLSAVRNYASYLAGEHAWMLGSFIVPFHRLNEFEEAAIPHIAEKEWRVAVLGVPTEPLSDRPSYVVDVIEWKAERPESIEPGIAIPSYYEVPTTGPDAQLESLIGAIAKAGARAKIRTGGLSADAVPPASRIARFLSLCHRTGIAFKATAGLHHPIRGVHPFTYEPESARGVMHGFLNVFLAAALTFNGSSESEATLLLEEKSAENFHVAEDFIGWQSHRYTAAQIREVRERFAIGFGSCSFVEPVSDLKALGFL